MPEKLTAIDYVQFAADVLDVACVLTMTQHTSQQATEAVLRVRRIGLIEIARLNDEIRYERDETPRETDAT